jgi:hypothetical protein
MILIKDFERDEMPLRSVEVIHCYLVYLAAHRHLARDGIDSARDVLHSLTFISASTRPWSRVRKQSSALPHPVVAPKVFLVDVQVDGVPASGRDFYRVDGSGYRLTRLPFFPVTKRSSLAPSRNARNSDLVVICNHFARVELIRGDGVVLLAGTGTKDPHQCRHQMGR